MFPIFSYITKFNQTYIDITTIKKFIKDIANETHFIHNIDKPIEEQELPLDTKFNYIKLVEPFYGNVYIEIGTFNYHYVNSYESFLPNIKDIITSNSYSIEISQFELIYDYHIDYTINFKDCTTEYIIKDIKTKLLEHSLML